ncbi:transmembrane protein 127-like [Pseudophryne corroboree]|uniref:transmembrane protein 127-like n=1 Tax=Pseudophryne corroboree TaxID=495146 RepID=UPI003081CDB7
MALQPCSGHRSPELAAGALTLSQRCLPAAFSQTLAVVSACTALADPSWLLVQMEGREYVYGPAYVLHRGFNLTETGPYYLLYEKGLCVLVLILTCCYASIVFGFSAFLLDFLDTRFWTIMGMKVSPALHFITVLSSGAAVAQCSYLYVVLSQEVHFQIMQPPPNYVSLGESFYFAIFACIASIVATGLSLYYPRRYRREYHTGTPTSQTDETSPLLQDPEASDSPGEYG